MKRREILSSVATLMTPLIIGPELDLSESATTGWTQFGGGPRNTGCRRTTPTTRGGASHATINTLQDLGDIHNVIFSDGIPWWDLEVRRLVMTESTIIYTGPLNDLENSRYKPNSATGGVVAIDRKTGEKKWIFSENPQPFKGGVAISDDIVVGLQPKNTNKEKLNLDYEGGYIYGIDLETGEKIWRNSFKGEPEHPPVSVNGTTYAVAGHHNIGKSQEELKRHQIIAVDNETGETKWEITDNPELYRNVNNLGLTPAADSDGLFFSFGASKVAKITLNGNLDWCTSVDPTAHHRSMGTPVLDDEYVYGVHDFLDPHYYRINKQTGEIDYLETLDIGLPLVSLTRPALTDDFIYITATAAGTGTMLSDNSSVLKINKESGDIVWETKISNWVTAPLTVTSNAIFASTAGVANRKDSRSRSEYLNDIDNRIFALDPNNGNKIYSLDLDYHPASELIADNDGIYFLDHNNLIHRIYEGESHDTKKIPVPNPTIKLNRSSKTEDESIIVNAKVANSSSNSTQYRWQLDGNDINSTNSDRTSVNLSIDEPGDHNITLIAASGNGNIGSTSESITISSQTESQQTEAESQQTEKKPQQIPSNSATSPNEDIRRFGILSLVISGAAGSYWFVRSQTGLSSEDTSDED